MTQDKEPIVDWQLEYMKLAKTFLQYIVSVHVAIPEYQTIAGRVMDEQEERRTERKDEMVRFLFQRYGIEYNEENLKQYRQSEYDFWGECLDARDTEDGGVYIPPQPTTTHRIIIAISWSDLVTSDKSKKLLERDLEDADFRLPEDRSQSKGGTHHYPEDREEIIARMTKYVDSLKIHTFIGSLKSIEDNPKEVVKSLGLTSDTNWFTSSNVESWIKWRKNH